MRHLLRIGAEKTPFSQKHLILRLDERTIRKTDIWIYKVASLLKISEITLLYLDSSVLNPLAPIESKVMNISIVGLPEARPYTINVTFFMKIKGNYDQNRASIITTIE